MKASAAAGSDLIRILPAHPEHLPEIAALAEVIWRACYPAILSPAQIDYMLQMMYSLETLRRDLERGVCYDRLIDSGALVGYAGYEIMRGAGEMKLHKLYVHQEKQRRGLGSMLLRHVEKVTRNHGLSCLMLTVNKNNQPAITAYRKNGFRIRDSIVTDIGGGFVMDDFIMEKKLD